MMNDNNKKHDNMIVKSEEKIIELYQKRIRCQPIGKLEVDYEKEDN